MPTILVADNRKPFVELAKLMLERAGYSVVTAMSPADASRILAKRGCDAAILDYRLKDDTDLDRSGLEVAEKADSNIPKIFVSAEVKKEDVMAAVQVGKDGRPIAVRFLAKSEVDPKNPKLTDTVHEALEIGKQWKRQSRERINPELYRDYRRAAMGGMVQDIVHIVASVAFVFLMVWGAVELHGGVVETAFMIAGVVVGEIVNLLLAGKGEGWKERVEKYHQELLQSDRYEHLLASCESLPDSASIARAKEDLIRRASEQWIGVPAPHKS
jgi:CheY-like chemotaxis protein